VFATTWTLSDRQAAPSRQQMPEPDSPAPLAAGSVAGLVRTVTLVANALWEPEPREFPRPLGRSRDPVLAQLTVP